MGQEKYGTVDIVYLWVDGKDPTWRLKRQQAGEKLSLDHRGAMAVYSNVEGRFRDNDELRCNLRALERFFPDHGHVYVVTDGQTPEWLCASERLTVIDHKDLIPAHALPTFDSGNIESYIHRIPQLSERYFYLNDDVFFGGPVDLDHWFWEDGIYVGWSDEPGVSDEPLREDATSLENACRLSHQWLNAHVAGQRNPAYTHTARTFAHSPRPMRRSVLVELESLAPGMFEVVRSTVFRTWDKPTIISDFVMRWSLANSVARVRDYAHMHVSTGEDTTRSELEVLAASLGTLDFFCINDTTDDAHPNDPRLVQVREALHRMFAEPSGFEDMHAG
ncbi:MAG: hypothetical protein RLZZ573_1149 [Pseudomonadota bacterium]|jgi:hypothetical protein